MRQRMGGEKKTAMLFCFTWKRLSGFNRRRSRISPFLGIASRDQTLLCISRKRKKKPLPQIHKSFYFSCTTYNVKRVYHKAAVSVDQTLDNSDCYLTLISYVECLWRKIWQSAWKGSKCCFDPTLSLWLTLVSKCQFLTQPRIYFLLYLTFCDQVFFIIFAHFRGNNAWILMKNWAY